MSKMSDRFTRFVDLVAVQLDKLPSKIKRLHHKWQHGISVPSYGFVIWSVIIEEIINFNKAKGNNEVSEIPVDLRMELLSMYRQMKFEKKQILLAVRGALSIEDQSNASWAGGSESPTNIIGEEEFLEAILICIKETFNGNMAGYAKQMGINEEAKLSILVHNMAKTDAFAIVFTKNPLNGSSQEVLIQSTFGGGQLLTSGDESGDIFVMSRSGEMLNAQVNGKEQMVTPEGIVRMPEDLRQVQSLDSCQLAQLVAFALKVEILENGVPQDFEIAISFDDHNKIVCTLVQNRPVTTEVSSVSLIRSEVIAKTRKMSKTSLSSLQSLDCDMTIDVFSDQNIAELLTQHPTRFSFGLFTYIFAHGKAGIRIGRNLMGYNIGNELDDGFFQLIGGQARVSIIKDALSYRITGIPLKDYCQGFVSRYLYKIKNDKRLANYPEVVLYQQCPNLTELIEIFGHDKGTKYHVCYERFFAKIRRLEGSFARKFLQQHEPDLNARVEKQGNLGWEDMKVDDLVDVVQDNLDYLRLKACVWFVINARLGFFAYARLRENLEKNYSKSQAAKLLDKLTSGLKDDPTNQFNIELTKLRDGLCTKDDVLKLYGHLGFNELEISGPRFHESPDILDIMAKQLSGDPSKELVLRTSEFEEALAKVLAEAKSNEKEDLKRDIDSVRCYLVMRERSKYSYLRIYDLIRQQLLRLENLLEWTEDSIFWLDPRELNMLKVNPVEAVQLVRTRQEKNLQHMQIEIPQIIFTDNLDAIDRLELPNSATELEGIGVTSYVSEGVARIVIDPKDHEVIKQINEGDILVSPTTDPAWSAIMASLGFGKGGLITEVGGPLAHGAVIARELHLGAVLNVPHATKIIKDGQRVRVDGPTGKIYILD